MLVGDVLPNSDLVDEGRSDQLTEDLELRAAAKVSGSVIELVSNTDLHLGRRLELWHETSIDARISRLHDAGDLSSELVNLLHRLSRCRRQSRSTNVECAERTFVRTKLASQNESLPPSYSYAPTTESILNTSLAPLPSAPYRCG